MPTFPMLRSALQLTSSLLQRLPVWLLCCTTSIAQQPADFTELQQQFRQTQQGVLQKYCLDCHSTAAQQGDLDLERFQSVADIRADVVPWQRVLEVLDDGEMPPAEAEHQPTAAQKTTLRNWVRALLDADALANA
ncbi:MAG: c-type cytochrome domain-containing protein [Planctomycetaceae bacterium]